MSSDADRIRELEALVAEMREVIEQLRARVAELEAELSRHSGNSSKPPSSDTLAQRAAQKARREQWTRKGRGKRRKPGKQSGDPGRHLAQVADPDVLVRHPPHQSGVAAAGDPSPGRRSWARRCGRSSTSPRSGPSSPPTPPSAAAAPAGR